MVVTYRRHHPGILFQGARSGTEINLGNDDRSSGLGSNPWLLEHKAGLPTATPRHLLVNDISEGIWLEVAVAYFELISQNLSWGTNMSLDEWNGHEWLLKIWKEAAVLCLEVLTRKWTGWNKGTWRSWKFLVCLPRD
jgi:hypothetical protein